jgi:hypothetical protein
MGLLQWSTSTAHHPDYDAPGSWDGPTMREKRNGMIRIAKQSRDRVPTMANDELEPTFDRFVDVAVLQRIVI